MNALDWEYEMEKIKEFVLGTTNTKSCASRSDHPLALTSDETKGIVCATQ